MSAQSDETGRRVGKWVQLEEHKASLRLPGILIPANSWEARRNPGVTKPKEQWESQALTLGTPYMD